MAVKIVVSGSRKYGNYAEAKEYIDTCVKKFRDETLIFVSGGCKGADMLGERYAEEKGCEILQYPAEWSKYGSAAGPIRNKAMVDVCDMVICFWDGKSPGTKSMIACAEKAEKQINIKIIAEE